jgi:hypothetical protein
MTAYCANYIDLSRRSGFHFLQRLHRFSDWMDAHRRLLMWVLVVAYFTIALPIAYLKPLWHDELVTYDLANSPSLSEMLREIRQIDLNPPLLYLLDYGAIRIPGVHSNNHLISLAARMPSIVGGLLASVGMFSLLQRRLGALYGLAGVGLLWNTAFLPYVWEDRPYALLTGLLMLSILAWERASQPERSLVWVGWSFCLGLAMVSSHFMAVFLLSAFLATELVRGLLRRRIDLLLCLAYLLPFAVPVYYFAKIAGYRSIVFPLQFQPMPMSIPVEYLVLWQRSALILCAFLFFYMIKILSPRATIPQTANPVPIQPVSVPTTPAEQVLLVGILLEPAVAVIAIMRSHGAFFVRYGLPGCIPIVILSTVFLYALFEKSRVAALFLASASIAVAASSSFVVLFAPPRLTTSYLAASGSEPAKYRMIEPDLPFVDASGLTYVEMNHREPAAFLHRTYYLTDTPSAIKYAHATLFEGEAEVAQTFHFQSKVEALQSFQQKHPKFLVLGTVNYPEDWLLRKLITEGYTVRYLGSFTTSYKDKDLYEVSLSSR